LRPFIDRPQGWPCGDALLHRGIGRRLAPWALIERCAALRAGFGARLRAAQRPIAIMGFERLFRAFFDAFFRARTQIEIFEMIACAAYAAARRQRADASPQRFAGNAQPFLAA
jgi:hypothetical protein